jgi:hypothetical protein
MFDLKKNDPAKAAEVGYTLDLTLPDGTKTDAKITVRGANSPAVKNHARRVYQEFKVKEQQAKRRGKEPEDLTLEEAEDMAAEAAAVRVIGWVGIAEDGKEIQFTKDEAERIMKAYPFIREQVMDASDSIFNFRVS